MAVTVPVIQITPANTGLLTTLLLAAALRQWNTTVTSTTATWYLQVPVIQVTPLSK
jgi:hypothetical protein